MTYHYANIFIHDISTQLNVMSPNDTETDLSKRDWFNSAEKSRISIECMQAVQDLLDLYVQIEPAVFGKHSLYEGSTFIFSTIAASKLIIQHEFLRPRMGSLLSNYLSKLSQQYNQLSGALPDGGKTRNIFGSLCMIFDGTRDWHEKRLAQAILMPEARLIDDANVSLSPLKHLWAIGKFTNKFQPPLTTYFSPAENTTAVSVATSSGAVYPESDQSLLVPITNNSMIQADQIWSDLMETWPGGYGSFV
jgi:hypothetical protein